MFWEVLEVVRWGTEVVDFEEWQQVIAEVEAVGDGNYPRAGQGESRTPCWETFVPGTAAGLHWRVECKNWERNPEVVEGVNRWLQGSLGVEEEGTRAPGVSPQLGEEVEEWQKG